MIRNISRTWFEVWGTEEAQNRFLKALLVFFVTLCCTQSIALVVLGLREPKVIAVSQNESRVLTIVPPTAELLDSEIRRAVSGYVMSHYNWQWDKIEDSFSHAAKYVHPDFIKSFSSANQDQIKISKEKKISQRFYVSEIVLDKAAKIVTVSADRILLVENLRVTSPILLEVQFEIGQRTETNPEGVYIVGEKSMTGPSASEKRDG